MKQNQVKDIQQIITNLDTLKKSFHCDNEILNDCQFLLDQMLYKHTSVILLKFTLYLPEEIEYSDDNKSLEEFISRYTARISYNKRYYGMFWTRHKDFYRNNHSYKVIVLVDGYYSNHIFPLISLAKYYWISTLRCNIKRSGIFAFDLSPGEYIIADKSDINFDIAYYLILECCAQNSYSIKEENKESFGFISNSIKIKDHPLMQALFEEPFIESRLQSIE